MSLQSLAGTGRLYVALQARANGLNSLHIQGSGPEVNRSYGVAVDVAAPEELVEWLRQQPHTLRSLAGSDQIYVPIQARPAAEGKVHVQVQGTSPLNRSYGAAFNVESPELYEFVSRALAGE